MLDNSKIPAGLVVHQVWAPFEESDGRRPIAYVSDRRRKIIGAALIGLAASLVLAALVVSASLWLAFIPLLVAWAAAAYAGGGRTGFYEVRDDGTLGDYLGRSKPDLSSMGPLKR